MSSPDSDDDIQLGQWCQYCHQYRYDGDEIVQDPQKPHWECHKACAEIYLQELAEEEEEE